MRKTMPPAAVVPPSSQRENSSLTGAVVSRLDDDIDCTSEKVRYMFEWWRRAAGGLPPYWSQFDITDHPSIIASVFLVKRLAARSWFFTLKGEEVHALFPSAKTPDSIDGKSDSRWAKDLVDYYEEVAATGRCHMVRGTITGLYGEEIDIESIDCPFREGDFGRMAILGVIEKIAVRPKQATA
ncbi:MAG: hypothetical protein R3F55_18125 [Alphaproteobacteria bacterium]